MSRPPTPWRVRVEVLPGQFRVGWCVGSLFGDSDCRLVFLDGATDWQNFHHSKVSKEGVDHAL